MTASHAATAINNARLFRDTERRARNLEAVRDINNAVLNSLDLQLTLPQILAHIQARLAWTPLTCSCLILILNALTFAAGLGFRTDALNEVILHLGEGFAGRVALEKKIANIPDINTAGELFPRAPLLKSEDIVAYRATHLSSR